MLHTGEMAGYMKEQHNPSCKTDLLISYILSRVGVSQPQTQIKRVGIIKTAVIKSPEYTTLCLFCIDDVKELILAGGTLL